MPHYEYKCHSCGGTTLFLMERVISQREKLCTHCLSFDIILVAYYQTAQAHILKLRETIRELAERIDALESGEDPCQDVQVRPPN